MNGQTNSAGIPLPPDLRSGPVIVGVETQQGCARPIRAAVFLARSLDREVVLVHVRRRLMPLAEGYVPIGDDLQYGSEVEAAMDAELTAQITDCGDLDGVRWELVSTYGEAAAELIRIAQDRDAACVVVGKRHGGFGEILHRITSGSVSRAIISAQKFPVLIVP